MPRPPVHSAAPPKLTKLNRNLLRNLLLLVIVSMLAVLIYRRIAGWYVTPEQRRQQQQAAALERQPDGQPASIREELNRAYDRATRAASAADTASVPADKPGNGPLPSGYSAPGGMADRASATPDYASDDKARLAEQKLKVALQDRQVTAWQDESEEQTIAQPLADNPLISNLQAMIEKPTAPVKNEAKKMGDINAAMPEMSRVAAINGVTRTRRDNQWIQAQAKLRDDSPLTARAALSEYMIRQGWVIPCVQLQPLKSDAPNTVRCMVTTDIYSSNSRSHKLIPWGSTLVGSYSTAVSVGQSYILAAYRKLYFPNNASILLLSMPAGDANGYGGLKANVNNHFFQMFGAAFMISAAELIAGRNQSNSGGITINLPGANVPPANLTQAAAQDLSTVVQSIVQRNQYIQPTLTLGPGHAVSVIVNRDLIIDPAVWGGKR